MARLLTADEKAAALKLPSSDLKFRLDKEEVGETVQANLYHSGITTMSRFAVMASDIDDLRTLLKASTQL
jgi:hypothetical protein